MPIIYRQGISLTTDLLKDVDTSEEELPPVVAESLKPALDLPETISINGTHYTRKDVMARRLGYVCHISICNIANRYGLSRVFYKRNMYVDTNAYLDWHSRKMERHNFKERWK